MKEPYWLNPLTWLCPPKIIVDPDGRKPEYSILFPFGQVRVPRRLGRKWL